MRRMWKWLSDMPIAGIYSSPSRRALESAAQRAVDDPAVNVDERLQEIDFGKLEGLTYHEVASRFPTTHEMWMTDPTTVRFPGGEHFTAMRARVLAAVDDIRIAHAGRTVVNVTHGGVNRIVLAAALRMHARDIFRIDQAYANVSVIDYYAGEPVVRLINDITMPC